MSTQRTDTSNRRLSSHGHGGLNETSPLLPDAPRSHDRPGKLYDEGAFTWKSEFWLMCRSAGPLIITYLLQYSSNVITTIVAGRLGAEDLAAASISLTAMAIPGFALFEGMATALDTLCAQAYGSGHRTGVGLHIQRMLLLMAVAIVPVGALWMCAPWILPLVVRQEFLPVKASAFLRVSVAGLPGYAFFEAGKRFLQAQGDFNTALLVLVLCAPVNALLSWLFAIKLGMGLQGAALGQALANNLRPILLLGLIVFFRKWSHECWGGWSRSCLREWGPMVRLSVAGSIVILAEWMAFEILCVSTSYIGTEYLAAQSVLVTVAIIMWHVPFSISIAVTTRIGNLIGGGAVQLARRAAVMYSIVFVGAGLLVGTLLFVLRNELAFIFSKDSAVREIATGSMFTVSIFHTLDAISCGCNGMMRGLARQSVSAWVVMLVNYLGAVPLALWLELGAPHLKLNGLWMGYGCGLLLTAVLQCGYMKWLRWADLIEDVRKREAEET
ncbi:unnamed protein product [Clonostachys rosea f. rosea IK726]|jgi:MATE family multidrug resistance protein|uniref:MATE efflux family protein n=2 Tax=Bionectria ochroleuca TaxID=29856 RepID=A0A0B7KLS1_BIOOC|nr:unnamed protein product [Clonostachys rosea f. rosea IK726]